jgi:hypothetical protein
LTNKRPAKNAAAISLGTPPTVPPAVRKSPTPPTSLKPYKPPPGWPLVHKQVEDLVIWEEEQLRVKGRRRRSIGVRMVFGWIPLTKEESDEVLEAMQTGVSYRLYVAQWEVRHGRKLLPPHPTDSQVP